MKYEWKLPGVVPVSAETAGAEFERIYAKYGKLDSEIVVEESKAESSPLHACFEWDDAKAASEYRRTQASHMIRLLVTTAETTDTKDVVPVRAFVTTKESGFQPLTVVLQSPNMYDEMMRNALNELKSFRRKYETLKALTPVFDAIAEVEEIA